MNKVYLISDFRHKDFIKLNGGKWDAQRKQWYLLNHEKEALDKILMHGIPFYHNTVLGNCRGQAIYPKIDTSNKKTVDLFIDSDDE